MSAARTLRATALLALAAACAAPPGSPRAVVVPPGAGRPNGAVEVHGLNEAQVAAAALELFVRQEPRARRAGEAAIRIPVAGATRRSGDVLSFEPAFALTPGLTYRARVTGLEGDPYGVNVRFDAPEARPHTLVTAIYPSAETLPENLLRFYVWFSAPMRRGEAYEHVRLIEAGQGPVEDAILEVRPELWDPEARRLTLLLQPGRIKRGLVPREELGPPLRAGRRYVLEIAPGWRDARGAPLVEGYARAFRATAPDDTPPDPTAWVLAAPAPHTVDPLSVTLDEALDHALLERVVTVVDPRGEPVVGVAVVAGEERRWIFTPASPWALGTHELRVDSVLEDRAGNGVGRPFETSGEEPARSAPVVIPFAVQ